MKKQKGFTVIEVALYIAISSIILFAFVTFLFALLETRIKSEAVTDIDQQQMFVMQLINQEIRNAKSILSPAFGTTSSILIIETVTTSTNPIIFQLSSLGYFQMSEYGSATTTLTDSSALVSNLVFSNFSTAGTNGSIQTEFELTHVNPSLRNEYNFSRQVTSTASVRQ